jgi:hypothetical protein
MISFRDTVPGGNLETVEPWAPGESVAKLMFLALGYPRIAARNEAASDSEVIG